MMMRHSTGIGNNRNLFYIKGKSCTSNMKEERERETVCVCVCAILLKLDPRVEIERETAKE